MADRKTTDLTELTLAELADDDVFHMVDVSEGGQGTSKKFKAQGVKARTLITATVGASQSLVPGTVVSFVKNTVIAGTGSATLESSVTWSNNNTSNVGQSPISAVKLTDTTFFVAYSDVTSSLGRGVVGAISNGVVTFGTPVTFESGGLASGVHCVALTSSKIAIAYADDADTSKGKFIAATISGTTPTFGSEQTFFNSPVGYISMAAMTSSSVLIAFSDSGTSSQGTVIAGTISGTVATFGSTSVYNSGINSLKPSVCRLSDTAAFILFGYFITNTANLCCAVVTQISGTTITSNSSPEIISFTAASSDTISVCAIAPDQVVMGYSGITGVNQTNNYLYAQVAKIYFGGGTGAPSISIGKPTFINIGTSASTSLSITSLKDNRVYISHQSSTLGVGTIGIISGSDIRFGGTLTFESSAMSSASAITLSSQLVINFYTDAGNSNRGTATPVNLGQYLGICQSTGTDGDTVTVAVEGVSNVHSGLIPGAFYYSDSAGVLSTDIGQPVGMALSATEIFMDARAVTGFFFELCGNGAMWRADGQAGHGSTATKIPYYTNIRDQSLAVYATISNASTNGLNITINQKGIYSLHVYSESPSNTTDGIMLTINDNQLTTNGSGIGGATVLNKMFTGPIVGNSNNFAASWTGRLNVGDIVRPHDDGLTAANLTRCGFSISLIQRLS